MDGATAVCLLHAVPNEKVGRIEIPALRLPPELASLAAAAGEQGLPAALGAPLGGEAHSELRAKLRSSGRLDLNSLPLMRRARAAAAQAGGAIQLVVRAEPAAGRCRVWLAMPGCSAGELEAGALPDGAEQLSEATIYRWRVSG